MSESISSNPPILFLTNNSNTENLRKELVECGENLVVLSSPLRIEDLELLNPSFVISFNYKHIVNAEVIRALEGRIANVHCSLLPFNRGAYPNFFSWYCNTPKGVTIHQMDERLDKGAILLQEELHLSEDETFHSSYSKLIDCATHLVLENWGKLSRCTISSWQPIGSGSYHSIAEFEEIRQKYPFEWRDVICAWKEKFGLRKEPR